MGFLIGAGTTAIASFSEGAMLAVSVYLAMRGIKRK